MQYRGYTVETESKVKIGKKKNGSNNQCFVVQRLTVKESDKKKVHGVERHTVVLNMLIKLQHKTACTLVRYSKIYKDILQ